MSNNLKFILIGVLSTIVPMALGAGVYGVIAAPVARESNMLDTFVMYGGKGRGGIGRGCSGDCTAQLATIPVSDLSTEESEGLLFMREEEKLARDVYSHMYALWGQPIFQNIASSEQNHMDQVKLLLDRYDLADPALDPGQFTDANLQTLYDELIARGSVSLDEALKVGALIEQTDINDLQTRLAQTDNADVQMVYNNLMNASYQHLNAFTAGGQQNGMGAGRGYGRGNGWGGYGPQFQSGNNTP